MEKTGLRTDETKPLVPHCLDVLPPEILKKAEQELNETPKRRIEAIKELRRLIHAEADFRPVLEESFLLRFLRVKKFDVAKAFNMIKNYYTFKVRYSKILTDFQPAEVKHVFDQSIFMLLPYRSISGSSIVAFKFDTYDCDKVPMDKLIAAGLVAAETIISNDATQICGLVYLADCKGMSLKIIKHMASPRNLYRIVRVVQDCFPARFKAVHVVNEPFYISILFNIVKRFLTEKIKTRIFFHGSNLQSLHKAIPSYLLTKEFDGELGPFDCSPLSHLVLSNEKQYEKNSKYGFQEKRAQFIRKKSSLSLGLYA